MLFVVFFIYDLPMTTETAAYEPYVVKFNRCRDGAYMSIIFRT